METKPMTSFSRRLTLALATVLSLGIASLAMPAFAQTAAAAPAVQEISPEHLAMARKYVDLTDKQAVYETTVVQVAINTTRQILSQNPSLTDKVNTVVGDVVKTYKPRKGELLDQIARVYAQKFTMAELKQITDFYASPTGQKLVSANVGINRQLQQVMQLFQANLSSEFYAKVKADLKKEGVDI